MTPEVWQHLAERPGRVDLFQALRRIEAAHPHLPRLGDAVRPADEPVRFAGDPALDFAPAAIARIEQPAGRVPRLVQRVLGLFGPNGALPTHLTEYARERALHHGDRSVAAFADMLLHRFGLFFYRAWARSRPGVGLDRGRDAPIVRQVGALIGLPSADVQPADALGDWSRLQFAARLARPVRDADGLAAWIRLRLGIPAEVVQFAGHWMRLQAEDRTRLTRQAGAGLGRGAVLGRQVWDVQHKFRIEIGPLDWSQYQDFLPGGRARAALQAMVRQYVGAEFAWDLKLTLAEGAVPAWPLGRDSSLGRLGRTAWMKAPRRGIRNEVLVTHVDDT